MRDVAEWSPLDDTPQSFVGNWWVPGRSDNKVPGELTLRPNAYPELDLQGTFRESIDFDLGLRPTFDNVRGRLRTGEHLTLIDSIASPEIGIGESPYELLTLYSDMVIIGPNWVRPDTNLFATADVQLAGLAAWMRPFVPLPSAPLEQEADLPREVDEIIGVPPWSPREFRIDDRTQANLLRSLGFYPSQRIDSNYFNIEERFTFRLDFEPRAPIPAVRRRILRLRDFLVFCLQRSSPVIQWKLWRRGPLIGDDPYHVYMPVRVPPSLPDEPDQRDHLFAFQHMEEEFEEMIETWMEIDRQNDALTSLIIESLFYTNVAASTKFLSLVRCVEALYEQISKDGDEEVNEISPAIEDPLIESLMRGFPESVKSQISVVPPESVGPPLLEKLNCIIERATQASDEHFSLRKDILQELKHTRDYYAHHDPRLASRAVSRHHLPIWNEFLHRVVNLVMLEMLGADTHKARFHHVELARPVKNLANERIEKSP